MARDVTPSLGTALDRLAHSAQRVVGVVTELKQFGTLAASGRGASRAWHQHVDKNVVALALVNDRTDHGGVSSRTPVPHAWRRLSWQVSMEKGWPGWNARALGYFAATSCRRFRAAALRPARPRRGGPAGAGC